MATKRYDAIVIGAGQAGGPLSTALAKAGYKTALIEREHVGGTCINTGCTPTKTMVASARIAYLTQRSADYGVQHGDVSIDMGRVRERKRAMVKDFRRGSQQSIEAAEGLDLIFGEARFTGPKTLHVRLTDGGERMLSADLIFINTGARPTVLALAGLDSVPYLNSTTIMELDQVPEHLLVLGGGYIGLEFGQMFRRFGANVTIIEQGKQLLEREDEDVAEAVAKILTEDGIDIRLETNAVRVASTDAGHIMLTIKSKAGERTLTGSHLLVVTGRTPNTDVLDPQAAGVEVAKGGFVRVNDRLETNVPGIYAMGDVKGGPAFTHISYDDFRIIRTNLLEGGQASIKGRLVPYTIFIDPQLGRVGLTEAEAKEQGKHYRIAKMPMTEVARAVEVDETRGFMKALVDADSGHILGCAILGIEGGEIMTMLQLAMMGGLTYSTLHDTIFAHPTLAESLSKLFTPLAKG